VFAFLTKMSEKKSIGTASPESRASGGVADRPGVQTMLALLTKISEKKSIGKASPESRAPEGVLLKLKFQIASDLLTNISLPDAECS